MHINHGRYVNDQNTEDNTLQSNLEYKRALGTLKNLDHLNSIELQQVIDDLIGVITSLTETNPQADIPDQEAFIAQCAGSSLRGYYPRLKQALLNIKVKKGRGVKRHCSI